MPMRTVSASARARVQSRLNTAAAAAEFLSSLLREVGIVSSPLNRRFRPAFVALGPSIWRMRRKVNTRVLLAQADLEKRASEKRRGAVGACGSFARRS